MNERNPLALGSLIAAAVAWLLGGLGSCIIFFFPPAAFCTWVIFFGGSVVAVIFGHVSRSQIRASGGWQKGDGQALVGLGLGWAGIAINLLLICLVVVFVVTGAAIAPDFIQAISELIREWQPQ